MYRNGLRNKNINLKFKFKNLFIGFCRFEFQTKMLTRSKKIVICGNIGVGKTSLCNHLESQFKNSVALLENFEKNIHLEKYYDYIKEHGGNVYNPHSLPSQKFFVNQKIKNELRCCDDRVYFIDRSIYEDRYVFAHHQMVSGMFSKEEIQEYSDYFDREVEKISPPDLCIYLKASTDCLLERIAKRGREMEKAITKEFLSTLNSYYDDLLLENIMKKNPKCTIVVIQSDKMEQGHLYDYVSELIEKYSN